MPERALRGRRVLDLSSRIAGPYAAKLLVDAGCAVIKVETPAGDPLRTWTASGHALADGEDGALFRFLNASKRSVQVDWTRDEGRSFLADLIATSEIVIEDFGPSRARELEFGFEFVAEHNPRATLVSISPFGQEGPWAERAATEFTLQAAIGSIDFRGFPGEIPVAAGGKIGDWVAGSFAAFGALAGWATSRSAGRGRHVDVSMFESMILALTIYHDLEGQWREGKLPRTIETPSIERCRDGWVGLCTITGQQWQDFCTMIGRPDLDTPELASAMQRMAQFDRVKSAIEDWTLARNIDEIVELCVALRIPVAPIGDGRSILANPHLAERKVLQALPGGGLAPRSPMLYSRTPTAAPGPAPSCGQHTEEVRAELDRAPAPAAADVPGPNEELPLAGVRVVDFTTFWAGPICTEYLAVLGADVIKLESVQRPDGMRFAGAVPRDPIWESGPVFHGANCGKRAITLNLDDERGLSLAKRLIADADIVIENFSPRVIENFGLDWPALHQLNRRAILVRMPAFGLSGPWRDRSGFAMTVEQAGGLAWITGTPELPLVMRGVCDPVGGMHAAFAVLVALEERAETGEGQLVEVPLVEVALNVAAEQVLEESTYGCLLTRSGNRAAGVAPQGVYRCSDPENLLAIAVATEEQWKALVAVLGSEELKGAEMDGGLARASEHDRIDAVVERWLSTRTAAAAADTLLRAGVPASPVVNGFELSPNPQLEARGFRQEIEHPITGRSQYVGLPMRLRSETSDHFARRPPLLGEHTREVLQELGLADSELDELERAAVIGTRPSFL